MPFVLLLDLRIGMLINVELGSICELSYRSEYTGSRLMSAIVFDLVVADRVVVAMSVC